jgi:TM2 domain-containing membrane protein YozV
MAAGILGIMVGGFGVHNFYLGYTGKAVAQLLLMIVGIVLACVFVGYFMIMAAYIWGLVEGVMILTGSINTDADGNPLKD